MDNKKLEDKMKIPYYQTAKEALVNWNGLTEEQAEEYIANNDIDAIENGTPEVYGVGAKDSINSGLESIAKSLDLTDDEYKVLEDEVYNGVREKNSVLSSLSQRMNAKGLSPEKLTMDSLFDIHDNWVKASGEKRIDQKKDQNKLHQYARSEFIGLKETKSDFVFIKNILQSAGIEVNEEKLESEYNARRDDVLFINDIDNDEKLEKFIANDEYEPLEKFSQENKEKVKNPEFIKQMVQNIKEKGIGDPSKISIKIKKIDNLPDYIKEEMKSENLPEEVAKFARITARQGKKGEKIVTQMSNGVMETKNTVKLDEKTGNPGWIVTNPDGEQYIVEDSNFQKKYEIDPENPDKYKPKGGPVMSLKLKEDIGFNAPWGERMSIKSGGHLIISSANDIYGIQADEFNNTYAKTEKDTSECVKEVADLVDLSKKDLDNILKKAKIAEIKENSKILNEEESSRESLLTAKNEKNKELSEKQEEVKQDKEVVNPANPGE